MWDRRVSSATGGWCPAWQCDEWVRCRLIARPGHTCQSGNLWEIWWKAPSGAPSGNFVENGDFSWKNRGDSTEIRGNFRGKIPWEAPSGKFVENGMYDHFMEPHGITRHYMELH
eukprot:gene14582-biopygen3609